MDPPESVEQHHLRPSSPRLFSPAWWSTPARHPTLDDVLNRRTTAPIDLFSFYIYMRDQQRSVDYLDFWLDVSQHMTLCRHYVRHLRRSVLAETPDADRSSKRSSGRSGIEVASAYDGAGPSEKKMSEQRVSAVLRGERTSMHSHSNSQTSGYSHRSTPSGGAGGQPSRQAAQQGYLSSTSGTPGNQDTSGTSSSSPQAAGERVKREDIRASAERILYTYLLPGAEREIILPQSIVNEITQEIEENGRDDPEVFDAARDYVFQAMDRDAFPGFLQSKALGNLVPPSIMLRLILGLLGLFAGFWVGFALIFLDKGRSTRCWVRNSFALTPLVANSLHSSFFHLLWEHTSSIPMSGCLIHFLRLLGSQSTLS
jgi:Regulator of G protein signaling domain